MLWFLAFFGLMPTIIWLVFFLQEDRERPEPPHILLFSFLLGAVVTPIVFIVQKFYNDLFISSETQLFSFSSFLFLALIEELGKFLVIFWFIRKNKAFDESIDAMVYMVMSALGFATIENLISIFGFHDQPLAGIEVITLRLVGATLIHVFSSAIIGFYWGRALHFKASPTYPIVTGLSIAVLLHAAFNFLIINYPPLGLPLLISLVAGFFVFRDFETLKQEDSEPVS